MFIGLITLDHVTWVALQDVKPTWQWERSSVGSEVAGTRLIQSLACCDTSGPFGLRVLWRQRPVQLAINETFDILNLRPQDVSATATTVVGYMWHKGERVPLPHTHPWDIRRDEAGPLRICASDQRCFVGRTQGPQNLRAYDTYNREIGADGTVSCITSPFLKIHLAVGLAGRSRATRRQFPLYAQGILLPEARIDR